MRRNQLRLLAIAAAMVATASEGPAAQQHDRTVSELVERFAKEAIAKRQQVHQNPELSNREVKTAALVAEHLRRLGLDVRTGIARTGVVGILKGARPGR